MKGVIVVSIAILSLLLCVTTVLSDTTSIQECNSEDGRSQKGSTSDAETGTGNPMYPDAYAFAVVGVVNAGRKHRKAKGVNESEMSICEILSQVVEVLGNPIREKILKALPPGSSKTFDELRAETGISTGGLYNQLNLLRRGKYVTKTKGRPAYWSRTEEFDLLIDLAREGLKESYQLYGDNTLERRHVEAEASTTPERSYVEA